MEHPVSATIHTITGILSAVCGVPHSMKVERLCALIASNIALSNTTIIYAAILFMEAAIRNHRIISSVHALRIHLVACLRISYTLSADEAYTFESWPSITGYCYTGRELLNAEQTILETLNWYVTMDSHEYARGLRSLSAMLKHMELTRASGSSYITQSHSRSSE